MRIVVAFALEDEFAPWRRLREFRAAKGGAAEAYRAEIGAAEVAILLTGAGLRQAAAAAKAIRGDGGSIHCCISSGVAGALRSEYSVGQVLAARAVFSEAVAGAGRARQLESSEALIAFAAEYGATVVNRFCSAGRVIAKAEDKRHLGATADAVEMESFAILHEARECGIPAVAIRAISDAADEDLPLDMNEVFNREGHVSVPRVLGQVARRPRSVPRLLRLARQNKRAAESLAQFLDRYVAAVAERAGALETRVASVTE